MPNNTAEKYIEKKYLLQGLTCADCSGKIEEKLAALPQTEDAHINFSTCELKISIPESSQNNIKNKAEKIINKIEPQIELKDLNHKKDIDNNSSQTSNTTTNTEDKNKDLINQLKSRLFSYKTRFTAGSVLFAVAILLFHLPVFDLNHALGLKIGLYGTSYLLVGGPILLKAFNNLRNKRVFDENFLMTIATLGAFSIQKYPEGVAVMLFYMVGEMFQERAVDKSRKSIKELMNIQPESANLKKGDNVKKVAPEELKPGDIILIKPGEKVPVDGKVVEGSSRLDTSALTGESVPRKVTEDDEILSGMINQNGLLQVEVTKEYSQSTVSKILELVENASSKKAPTEKFITKFSRYYTPVIVYSALAIATLPPLLTGANFSDWLYRALIFLVVSCPCALVVSIPLGFFGGIGKASRKGILIKGGNYLEALNNLKNIVFDKTGTLTRGEFKVKEIKSFNDFSKKEVLKLAATAETNSNHPIAQSIKEAFSGSIDQNKIKSYEEISGQGIKTEYDGNEILVGNHKLLKNNNITFENIDSGGTQIHIAQNNTYAGYILISDSIKEDAASAVTQLRKQGINKISLLTGDIKSEAERISKKLKLDNFYAELLPQAKVEKIENLLNNNSEKGKIAFVGDGINDAPVIARSDLGIAMGGLGSDAAIEAADIVLMTDEPSRLGTAIDIAGKTKRIIWQNIILALGIKGIVLIMGAAGMASMWEAVFADVGVALLAVLNVMRIIK